MQSQKLRDHVDTPVSLIYIKLNSNTMNTICKHKRYSIIFLILLCSMQISNGQDVQFSQFYANVMHINPAFAGSAHSMRAVAHQRLQWPGLSAKFTTSSILVDNYFSKTGSGVGVLFLKDFQGTNRISSSEIRLQYAQEVNINSKFSVRAGAEINYVDRFLNYTYLTFPDQFNDNGFTDNPTEEPFGANRVDFFDIGLGGMIYSENFWLGIATHHINRPEQSFYDHGSRRLPAKFSFVAGYKFMIQQGRPRSNAPTKDIFITPTIHYKFQDKSDQLDLGIYGLYHRLLLGGWYRGMPLLKEYRRGIQNNESVVLLIGYKVHPISISYSYDFTLSKLARVGTGGAHEINISYVHTWPPKRKKIIKKLPCPDFR